ncbi:hypothetical protein QAD02_006985 [Eretmocerus hayati]|uniref:Uncharacterized protein n=1 Tax=Eretmocerus hayati TaxID=131215 RepID=A0ACC2N2V8_9HYME|nr:hypothetical protein QAD02_006985 [Eretmocerus hayati]
MDDAGVLMKLDAIKISSGRLRNVTNRSGSGPVRALEQRLRKFFDEADGHGSLRRKPPADLMTPQYFKIEVAPGSCNPIKRMDWIAFVNYANYKKLAKAMTKKPQVEQPPPVWAQKKSPKQQFLAPPASASSAVTSVTPEPQVDDTVPEEVFVEPVVEVPTEIEKACIVSQTVRRPSIKIIPAGDR